MSDTNNPWASPEETSASENQENTDSTPEHQETQIPANPQNSKEAAASDNPQPAQTQTPSLSGRIISVTPAGQASAEPAADSDNADQSGSRPVAHASSEVASAGFASPSDDGFTSPGGDGFTSSSGSVPAEQPLNSSTGSFSTASTNSTDPASANPTDPASANPTDPTSANAANTTNPASANPSAQYGANAFWGTTPGFSDPLANPANPLSGAASPNQGQPVGANPALPGNPGGNPFATSDPFAGTRGATNPLQNSLTWAATPGDKKEKSRPGWGALIGVAVAASLLSTGGLYAIEQSGLLGHDAETTSSTLFNPEDKDVATPEPVANSNSQNPNWEAVAKAVRPAVVAISVETNNGSDQGSGSIIDSKGHILTNNHVVAGAADGNGIITVELFDGRLYKAKIVGRDVLTDLAVIKIENPPKDLTVAPLGNSDNLKVGESVAAIGNPLGLSSTVTTGIVSALDRPVRVQAVQGGSPDGEDEKDPFGLRRYFGGGMIQPSQPEKSTAPTEVTTNAIQVDAAVNPGNSGGPLFDPRGRIVGVTSSIASLSGSGGSTGEGQAGSIGLGFAIPINQASMIATQLIDHGEAVHAALGVVVSQEVATVDKVSRLGARVQKINSGSAADKAGLKQGDIITKIDGKPVKGSLSLVGFVRQYAVGDTVELTVVRDGKEQKIPVTLQAQ
ncbi:S1C family serine protease [Mobiluncus sp.]|uniref:S1C family serine protease n=1 Tax=Mobiluncus sp. TaxID=47293 RepID=UPI002A90F24E|nr:trypsin-like peptidase domain-containing protein [Mobiluncus sp.]MDY6076239.1 trypsin-like peptidase domain-containing protein [Mobiluncus sp.]